MSASTAQPIFGRWSLASVDDKPAVNKLEIGAAADDVESALADDSRKPVLSADIRPGGKYYSIVKLQIKFEKQLSSDTRWAQGTGWLIADNLVVTAGHCAFDHTYNFGKAAKIRAYIGYNGKGSIGQPDVQFRQGRKMVTTKEWITSDINRANDVSLILLEKPFNNVVPINYNPTVTAFKDWNLGVVGYPADRTLNDEPGAQMYEMFKATTCDLSKTSLNMLEYTISSGAGQSGSPVLIDGQNTSIGAHVYGLGTKNSASVIRGRYGNYYKGMVDAVGSTEAPVTTVNGVEYIKTTQPEDAITDEPAGDEESFWDTFNNVINIGAKIGSTVLQVGTPFLGPIGAPVAAVAGTALSVIGKLTSGKTEDAFDDELGPPAPTTANYKYHASRAILGEAALQTFLKMGPRQTHKYDIISKMQARYKETRHLMPKVAKLIVPAITEPALRIAVDSQAGENAPKTYPTMPSTKDALDSSAQPFVNGLLKTVQNQGEQEDFFGFLSGIANTAANVVSTAGPIINAVGSIASAIGGGAEDSFEPDSGDLSPHVEVLCHRALLGDAALHALMSVPAKDIQEEGFFGDLVNTVKNIGSTVIKVAPTVIKTVTPIVQSLVGAMNQSETGNFLGQDTQVRVTPLLPESILEPKKIKQIQLPKQEDGLAWEDE
ncbi:Peptidase S1, PA clan, chymotrypsin-like fold [Fusarium oxysporum f. sp. vasinfectum]|uniref:Peptidase S1 domain-containing protein n=1 Tax=Fusarium oxysporum f. sp. vasinfectum 25433 TaxID=1089449 RepID=X0KSJ8_FUSOX|nr:hypothetical protein FOTG_15190 [Fusarium oxysporum f. sp. vasinfectum 25433]KAK2669773.1 Peptidase S1, PA clan, chymotrypsin-like fold [Fusarium oxysporum f. sp. vasinfectum]KAK2925288.1 Peptidase S1, PA clan, chymotrypsin-like fold [Fusarium oxysporum f. sp. vasinfectum]